MGRKGKGKRANEGRGGERGRKEGPLTFTPLSGMNSH